MPVPKWNENQKVDIATKYPLVKFQANYLDMQAFFTSELRMGKALRMLEVVAKAQGIRDETALHLFLSAFEKSIGLQSPTCVNELLSPNQFLAMVRCGCPIKDIGAGDDHGLHTHRMQWCLYSIDGDLRKRVGDPLAQMYKHLGAPEARVNRVLVTGQVDNNTLWYDLFDRAGNLAAVMEVPNGTCPEYLKAYALEKVPALNAVWY